MDEQKALSISQLIMKDVFGKPSTLSLEEMEKVLAEGIELPAILSCTRTGVPVHIYNPQDHHKVLSQSAFLEQAKTDDWMLPKEPIENIDQFIKAWERVSFMEGDKCVESEDVAKSDSVNASQSVYMSTLIISSKNIILSHNNSFSNYLLACKGNNSCNFGIRIFDSAYCSSSYEVRWSNKISRSLFITDSMDLFECIGCFGIRSKKYCIANMQYEKEEYMKIKTMIIEWIFNEWEKKIG